MKQQDVIEFFDQAAAGWDAQLRRNEPVIARILDNAGVRSGVRVLDVACGTGVLIPDYLQRGAAQVTAIDISPEMARIAREKFPQENVTVLCGDAEQAHFPALFDCIVIYNAFPHFPEPERLLAHLAGLLAPGGTLTVAHGFSRKTLDAHHAKTARQVSNGILPVQELAKLCAELLSHPERIRALRSAGERHRPAVAAERICEEMIDLCGARTNVGRSA